MLDLDRPNQITLTFYDKNNMPDERELLTSTESAFGKLVVCQTDEEEKSFYLVTRRDIAEKNIPVDDVIKMAINSVNSLKPMPAPVIGDGAAAPEMISIGQPNRFNGGIVIMTQPDVLYKLVDNNKYAYIFPCTQSSFVCIVTDPETGISMNDASMIFADFKKDESSADIFDGPVFFDSKEHLFKTFDDRRFPLDLPSFTNISETAKENNDMYVNQTRSIK